MRPNSELLAKAKAFLISYHKENQIQQPFYNRLRTIKKEIERTGTYFHTFKELEFGARVAWRNSNRCIGRLYWKSLNVIDKRHLERENEIEEALFNHLKISTNNGAIKPSITIFRQKMPNELYGIRIHNSQLINYAGYQKMDKTVIGDPQNIEFTNYVQRQGWKGKQTNFDVLPIIWQFPNRATRLLNVPKNLILEVNIEHPTFDWMKDLGLKWYALPTISNMYLKIGGIEYTAAPFSGWYMTTEIGARNLSDKNRYNQLPIIAQKMGLNTERIDNFWKDRALIELTQAVSYSFNRQGVRMSNHHTASEHFMIFQKQEENEKRAVTADWEWIVPPISGSSMAVFHTPMNNEIKLPNFFFHDALWQNEAVSDVEKKTGAKCPYS